MGRLNLLNRKQAKPILKEIEEHYGATLDWTDKYALILTDRQKLYLVNRDIENVELDKLNVSSIGLYVAEVGKGNRLSIEGAQMVAKTATQNILALNEEQAKAWLRGEDVPVQGAAGFVLVKYNEDILGCGNLKEGVLLNYVPKNRRVPVT
ncbi:MAG: hypothetical protein QF486_04830 [Candidatus Woesearchaeota archaeon]|jgi:NOL1/NOP2/fmu family ribosome biogenesis protein|nr:hypothetical protein [Candidatus Woesearchaeota archaeon]MDP7198916.1 hypothetical protein [Candidatus Woesearchaeota archaeon]MDP7467295.1 hypothetical protein [Candidatus Woesearchaeota archaeon]MDP7647911.1 hypothetical protein [Candidatus Woesearchaeota archaeon]